MSEFSQESFSVRIRFLKMQLYLFGRWLIFAFWKLWLRRFDGLENLPTDQGAILFANHTSYLDFLLLRPILSAGSIFVATQKFKKRPILHWFMRYGSVMYIDIENPGFGFFKEMMRQLRNKKHIVIYPEGTRSRSGEMMMPKIGFVKLALKANVAVIPVAIKGAYMAWPPHLRWPRLRRCEIEIGKKMFISPSNAMFRDIFFRAKEGGKFSKLSRGSLQLMACRLMDVVRKMAAEKWNESTLKEIRSLFFSEGVFCEPVSKLKQTDENGCLF